jgi:hypothetical protein
MIDLKLRLMVVFVVIVNLLIAINVALVCSITRLSTILLYVKIARRAIMTEKLIGYIGVDSGQMMLCDPCYIDSMWENTKGASCSDFSEFEGKFNYLGAAQATLSKNQVGILDKGSAAVCSTGWGDGSYPVYVTYEGNRVSEMRIVFMGAEEEDEDTCEQCNVSEDYCECEI